MIQTLWIVASVGPGNIQPHRYACGVYYLSSKKWCAEYLNLTTTIQCSEKMLKFSSVATIKDMAFTNDLSTDLSIL